MIGTRNPTQRHPERSTSAKKSRAQCCQYQPSGTAPVEKGILENVSLFAVLHVTLAGALVVALLRSQKVAELLTTEFRARDALVYLSMIGAAIAVSLGTFDAISNHAFRPHEEAYYFAFQGNAPPEGWNPLETQVLLRLLYQGAGQLLGDSMAAFVGTALLLGVWGPSLAGVAAQLLTKRSWIGYAVAVLLVLHPDLSYWRINAFQIAPPHVAFCLTLVLAALAARIPSLLTMSAWLLCASFAVSLRADNLGVVAATAAIPILLGPPGLLKNTRIWLPGFILGSILLGIPTLANIEFASNREDYHWGLSFLPLHLSVGSAYRPLTAPGLGLLIVASLLLCTQAKQFTDERLRRTILACAVMAFLGLFPDILFNAFGKRHLLGTSTAGLILAVTGSAAILESVRVRALSKQPRRLVSFVICGLLCGGAVSEIGDLRDLGSRYGDDTPHIPALPNTPRPTSALNDQGYHTRSLPAALERCGLYSGETYICDPWATNEGATCHPPKNLREPAEVRRLWDAQDGCVLWAVDDTCDDVSGVMQDWWEMVRNLYQWQPVGILPIAERNSHAEIYRLMQRP